MTNKIGDEITTLDQMKGWVKSFSEARAWDRAHEPKDLAIALVTEASEFLELFRYREPRQIERALKDTAAREQMADEMADTLFNLLRFAERHDFDLARGLAAKLEKIAAKYPATVGDEKA